MYGSDLLLWLLLERERRNANAPREAVCRGPCEDNSDQSRTPESMSEESTTPPDQAQPTSPSTESGPESRQDLLSKAQAFLSSPQIRDQDDAAKRKFLTQKGLTPAEVDYLLQGIVSA